MRSGNFFKEKKLKSRYLLIAVFPKSSEKSPNRGRFIMKIDEHNVEMPTKSWKLIEKFQKNQKLSKNENRQKCC